MARGMATATREGGDEKGDADANEEGDGDQRQQHWQWLQQRGWRAFDSGNDGDGAKDTPSGTTTGERGVMVATGHGMVCVCVSVCVEIPQKIRKRAKLSMYPRAFRKPQLRECVIFWQRGFLKVRHCSPGVTPTLVVRK